MKKWYVLFLFFSPFCSFGQLSNDTQAQVDSLNRAYEEATHDTTRAWTLLYLVDILYAQHFDTLKTLSERALALADQQNSPIRSKKEASTWMEIRGTCYSNIGVYESMMGRMDTALYLLQKAVHEFESSGNLHRSVQILNNLGAMYKGIGRMHEAVDVLNRSLKLAEQTGDEYAIASSLNLLGAIAMTQGEDETGFAYYRRSLEHFKKSGDKEGEALVLQNILLYKVNNDALEEALTLAHDVLNIWKERGYDVTIASAYSELAGIYIRMDEWHKADSVVELGLEVLKDKQAHSYDLLAQKAVITQHSGNLTGALTYAKRALKAAQQSDMVPSMENLTGLLYELYKEAGDYSQALLYLEAQQKWEDSLANESNRKKIIRQQYQYEYEKQAATDSIQAAEAAKVKDSEIARQDAELDAKRNEQLLLFGGLGLVVVFALFIFNRFRVTNKQKKVIETQKTEVERQKDEADNQRREAEHQKHLVEEKNQEIIDSINYARRLQEAILPPTKLVKEYLPDSFILYKPKDIVAGDFYWMETAPLFNSPPDGGEMSEGQRGAVILFAVADCTGHGVPGAMVSVVCSNALTKVLLEEKITEPGKMLDRTRELVIDQFARSEEEVKDGMDISLCALNLKTRQLQWAGANNPLWIIHPKRHSGRPSGDPESAGPRDALSIQPIPDRAALVRDDDEFQLFEVKADKQPIGKYAGEKPFTTHTIQLNEGDSIYIFSDGYPDQFGGEKGKKYKSGKLKKYLLSIVDKPHSEQRQLLLDEFENWRGDIEQIDDVCVIGVRV